MTDTPTLRTALRAGGVLLSALASPVGTRGQRGRLLGLGLIGGLAAGGAAIAYAAADKPPAPAERAAIETVVRDYILNHPEIIPRRWTG